MRAALGATHAAFRARRSAAHVVSATGAPQPAPRNQNAQRRRPRAGTEHTVAAPDKRLRRHDNGCGAKTETRTTCKETPLRHRPDAPSCSAPRRGANIVAACRCGRNGETYVQSRNAANVMMPRKTPSRSFALHALPSAGALDNEQKRACPYSNERGDSPSVELCKAAAPPLLS